MIYPTVLFARVPLGESLGQVAGVYPLTDVFRRLPSHLREDAPTLQRIANLIRPVDNAGTRGSYAGWITRWSLREAALLGNAPFLESLLLFFRCGGSLWRLETLAAQVLPDVPPEYAVSAAGKARVPGAGFFKQTLMARLVETASPLGEWRSARRRWLSSSEDPLKNSKLAELGDWRFYLGGDEGLALGAGFKSAAAYVRESDVRSLTERIDREAFELMKASESSKRYETTRARLQKVLKDHPSDAPLRRLQVIQALKTLGDDVSREAAERIEREYDLNVLPGAQFEKKVKERHDREGRKIFADPARQSAIYFPRSPQGKAAMFLRSRPLAMTVGSDPVDIFFNLLAVVIHEDDHHARLEALGYRKRPGEDFAFELHAHGVEYLWRARRGSPQHLRKLAAENPLGFALAFRDEYEIVYPDYSPSV